MIVPENVESNSQTASEMAPEATASEKVISESPQQQQSEPQTSSQQQQPEPQTSSQQQQPTNTPAEPQITKPTSPKPEPTVPEPTVPEQTVSKPIPEPTKSLTVSLPDQTIQITRYDGISLTSDMDLDSEDDQDDHSSDMVIDPIADQPSTSQPLTINDQPITS
jgi:outer membrane biosynthesis protein TonB